MNYSYNANLSVVFSMRGIAETFEDVMSNILCDSQIKSVFLKLADGRTVELERTLLELKVDENIQID
jgi:hypothetical protein